MVTYDQTYTDLPFRIRPLEGKDISAVLNIDRMVFTDPWPESAYVQEIYFNTHARYFVAQRVRATGRLSWKARRAALVAQIVGYVGMRVEIGKGHISTLAVRPDWRGYGLGELLLHKALVQAVEDGAQTVTLEVRVSNNIAQRLYDKYEFAVVSRLRGYYSDGEDAYLMRANVMEPHYQRSLQAHYTSLMHRLQTEAVAVQ